MLNVTTRSQSAPDQLTQPAQLAAAITAASVVPPQSAPLASDPFQPASDIVIPDAFQTTLDVRQELMEDYANDAWLANDANLQDWCNMMRCGGRGTILWSLAYAMCAQLFCWTTTTASLLAIMASTRLDV